jgi:hypothetical protein
MSQSCKAYGTCDGCANAIDEETAAKLDALSEEILECGGESSIDHNPAVYEAWKQRAEGLLHPKKKA